MSENIHQRAKTLFAELSKLSASQQQERLEEIGADEPDLADELSSLLNYHTAQSLVAPATAPKIRTRSTLSTHYENRSREWLTIPLRGLLVALPFFTLAILLSIWANRSIHSNMCLVARQHLESSLQLRIKELASWEQTQVDLALQWSQDPIIQKTAAELVKATREVHADELPTMLQGHNYARTLQNRLDELVGRPVKFAVWDRRMTTLATWDQERIPKVLGAFVTSSGANTLARILKGQAAMYLPRLSNAISVGYESDEDSLALSIFVPLYDSSNNVIATMMLRGYGLEEQYTSMLQDWNATANQELYLITREGAMISPSRYEVRFLPLAFKDLERQVPFVRDPGVDLVAGATPKSQASTWPDTLLARQIKSKSNGSDVSGYRNYAGQQVAGTWAWIPRHGIAMALETDYDTTFATANAFRWSLLGISTLFGLGLLAFSVATGLSRSSSRRLRDISEVGPYQIQEIIGEGGMGRVYLAEHALLCRQSAVKVLIKGEKDLSIISRFEREVQLASQLTHPNTIAIYDFGRNKDGIFYYAMEYINGAHLGQLLEYEGALPPGRCIYVLRQLCRALQEAHQAGVVHRDIKPQNIMVCDRGGEPDFVKLFDYGLVKAFAPGVSHSTSQTEVVVGTPRFMAPERLTSPWLADPRVDVYSIGALAYFLLTGQLPPLVSPEEGMESDQPGVETLDLPANVIDFGGLLSICMAVEPAARPSSMSSLIRELETLSEKFPWTRADSLQWWEKHEGKLLGYVQKKRNKLNAKD